MAWLSRGPTYPTIPHMDPILRATGAYILSAAPVRQGAMITGSRGAALTGDRDVGEESERDAAVPTAASRSGFTGGSCRSAVSSPAPSAPTTHRGLLRQEIWFWFPMLRTFCMCVHWSGSPDPCQIPVDVDSEFTVLARVLVTVLPTALKMAGRGSVRFDHVVAIGASRLDGRRSGAGAGTLFPRTEMYAAGLPEMVPPISYDVAPTRVWSCRFVHCVDVVDRDAQVHDRAWLLVVSLTPPRSAHQRSRSRVIPQVVAGLKGDRRRPRAARTFARCVRCRPRVVGCFSEL